MANESNANFEIPTEMRAMAEKSVEQARKAFDVFASAAQHAVTTAESQAKGVHSSAREAGQLAMRFAERNIASSFDFAQRLVRAKDAREVMALHTEYANSQMAALAEQTRELTETAKKMSGQGSH